VFELITVQVLEFVDIEEVVDAPPDEVDDTGVACGKLL
jgi:hypothetical protein